MAELVPSGKQKSIYQHNFKGSGIFSHSLNYIDLYFIGQPRLPHLKVLSLREAFFSSYLSQNKCKQSLNSFTRQSSNIASCYLVNPTL